jgi:uncharacterized protein YbaR (Trm112 family)
MSLSYALLTDIDDNFYDVNAKKQVETNDYDKIVGNLTGTMDTRQEYTSYPALDGVSTEDLDKITGDIDKKYNKNLEEDEHNVYLDHVLNCPECRKEVLRILQQKEYGTPKPSGAREEFTLPENDQIFDIIIYILTGVFVLFTLNMFLKLGKLIR